MIYMHFDEDVNQLIIRVPLAKKETRKFRKTTSVLVDDQYVARMKGNTVSVQLKAVQVQITEEM